MSFHGRCVCYCNYFWRRPIKTVAKNHSIIVLLSIWTVFLMAGCVSDDLYEQGTLSSYQKRLANQGPQQYINDEWQSILYPLDSLQPVPSQTQNLPKVDFFTDPNTGEKTVPLTIEQALSRTLANSPEITVVSYDPMLARQDITRSAAQFDVTAFSQFNYDQQDNPVNSIYQSGQSDDRTFESGIKQRNITGSEWSLSYAMTRSWDDLSGREFSTRYEPILGFQLRQPLLRDAWQQVNLAGVDIARLNYDVAMIAFRQKAEETAVNTISGYWMLLRARQNQQIYKELLDKTFETLNKVQGRREIDATDVQIKQAETHVKMREAALLQAEKQVVDAQDVLVRLMADSQLNLLDQFRIVPASEPVLEMNDLDLPKLLETGINNNPVLQQARIEIEIADINIRVAENQEMPRLDLLASARTQGLDAGLWSAQDRFNSGDYVSYGIGLSLEYPIGNRQREAELVQRRIQRRKAVSTLQNLTDQLTVLIKEGVRRIETNYSEINIQKEAVEAALLHLQAIEDTELIREQLTPEFLLVKLQAQESLANAQMSEIEAIANFNIALVELARTLGTVLKLQQVESSLSNVSYNGG